MKLIDEIIEMASDGQRSLADALRKCLILAFELKNDKLKQWTERELNGFRKDDPVPEYRKAALHSKGNFFGVGGSRLTNRPLPLSVLNVEDWDWLQSKLAQPIGAYEALKNAGVGANPRMNWPPDLIAQYQMAFVDGFALSSAWQEVPMSLVLGLCEEVRNRLLRFALEIRDELGRVDDRPAAVPPAKVEAAVVNYIYGGTNVIAASASGFTQIGNIEVCTGDFASLTRALTTLGIPMGDVNVLRNAIDRDGNVFGKRTKEWLAKVSGKIGEAGLKVGIDVSVAFVKAWLGKYFGGAGLDV
jgi:AbiTii